MCMYLLNVCMSSAVTSMISLRSQCFSRPSSFSWAVPTTLSDLKRPLWAQSEEKHREQTWITASFTEMKRRICVLSQSCCVFVCLFFYPLWTISNLTPLDWTTRLKPRWLRLMLSLNCSLNSGLLVPFTVLVLSLWASSCTQTCRHECTSTHLHTNWEIYKSALDKSEKPISHMHCHPEHFWSSPRRAPCVNTNVAIFFHLDFTPPVP